MGIVVDKAKAKAARCKCYQLGATKKPEDILCFSEGIIGTLTNKQDVKYCAEKAVLPPTEGLKERIGNFAEAIHEAQKRYKGEGIEHWLELTGEELRRRGIEV